MRRVSVRDRRAVAAGAAVLVPAILLVLVVLPAGRSLAEARDRLTTARAALEREQAVLHDVARVAAALDSAEVALAALAHDAFDAAEPQLAAVEVARTAELIAGLSGVGPVRVEPLAVEDAGDGWLRLRARIAGDATFASLVLLLYRLERDPSPLHVDQIAVRAAHGAGAGAADGPDALLTFTLVVQGIGASDRASIVARTGGTRMAGHAWRRSADDAPSENVLLASLIDDPFHTGRNGSGARGVEPVHGGYDAPALSIIGTVVLPDQRGLALVQWGMEPPRLVRVGDRIGGMRLRRVEPGAAEFEDETGSRLMLRVPKPGA